MINRLITKEFHFVVNKSLKVKLYNFSKNLKMNLSKTIIYIIENISVLSDKMYLIYKDENNKVEKLKWDFHIHIYLKKDKFFLYKKLKSIHKDNNTYSIASNLRYLLKVFFRGIELYGYENFFILLKKSKKKWNEKIKNKKSWIKNGRVRQLSNYPFFLVKYDNNFSAILIKLLILV